MCYLCPSTRTPKFKAAQKQINAALRVWRRKGDRDRLPDNLSRDWTKPAASQKKWTEKDFKAYQLGFLYAAPGVAYQRRPAEQQGPWVVPLFESKTERRRKAAPNRKAA